MHYERPEATDLANVEALNRAFLNLVSRFSGVPDGATTAATELAGRLVTLSAGQSECLAACPFLIFTLAENDAQRWRRLFDSAGEPDLVDAMQRPPEAFSRLAAASLGFLWELSRRNAYAARLVCGASLEWCESLAASTPIRLVQFATSEPSLLLPRFAAQKSIWRKLLGAGTSQDDDIRGAAHIAALQVLLTQQAVEPYRPMAAAACKTLSPALRVAEQPCDSREN